MKDDQNDCIDRESKRKEKSPKQRPVSCEEEICTIRPLPRIFLAPKSVAHSADFVHQITALGPNHT